MVYLDLKKEQRNQSVVPVFWADNHFNLLLGEECTVSVPCHTSGLQGQKVKIVVGGWMWSSLSLGQTRLAPVVDI